MKIAVNRCFGGFSVSKAVYKELGIRWNGYGYLNNEAFGITGDYDAWRAHPDLIAAIEKIGEKASSGGCAEIEIVDVPDGIEWIINDYDGQESISEQHRSW